MENIQWPDKKATAADVVKDLDLEGRHVIVTGANTGIGFESAKVLASRNATVVLACRNLEKAGAAKNQILDLFRHYTRVNMRHGEIAEIGLFEPNGKVEIMLLDLCDLASVEAFADNYKKKGWPLHVLMLNAGLYHAPELRTTDGFETTFQVNHLAQWYLIQLLSEELKKSAPARIVVVAALAHKYAFIVYHHP